MKQMGKIIATALAFSLIICAFIAVSGNPTGETAARNEFLPQEARLTPTLQILIPLYSYPSWDDPDSYLWDDVVTASKQVPITAIINPDNGPAGGPPNHDYQIGLAMLRSACVTILGYAPTNYGNRDIAEVKAEV